MTVAPKSASTRVVNGPAYTHVVSSTLIPSSGLGLDGSPPSLHSLSAASSSAERGFAFTASVWAPSAGGALRVRSGVLLGLAQAPGASTVPNAGSSTASQ